MMDRKTMLIAEIAELFGIDCPSEIENKNITSIAYDSRKVEAGSLFVAIRGGTSDGHNYIRTAISNGATIVICEDDSLASEFADILFIKVENCRAALAKVSHSFYDYPSKSLNVVGITGTNGKTTITFLLKSILESAGKKTGIIGTTGIFIGEESLPATHTTPESLELCEILDKMRSERVEYVIMEVSSHALDQHRADGISFSAGLFTNLTLDHLDYHHTMDDYALAKKILFKSLPAASVAIVNGDSSHSEFMLEGIAPANKIRIGRNPANDVLISEENLELSASSFKLTGEDLNLDIHTLLLGAYNIENAALAAITAKSQGISDKDIINGLAHTNGAPGRMQKVRLKNGATALVDYAHTPDALEKALVAAREVLDGSGGKLVCLFGCGGDRDKSKRSEMGDIAARLSDIAYVTSDNPRTEKPFDIIKDILMGIGEKYKDRIKVVEDRAEAIRSAVNDTRDGDILLLAGKGHENYQIIGKEKRHFDDVEELNKIK